MKAATFNISLTIIMVEDAKIGGYTAYFKQFPNIISEGSDEDEATENLMNALQDVFEYDSDNQPELISGNYNVKEKSVNFTSHELAI